MLRRFFWLACLLLLGVALAYFGSFLLPKEEKVSPPQPQVPQVSPAPAEEAPEDYFAEYALERSRVRAQQVQMLKEIISDPNATPQAKEEAQKKLMESAQALGQELQLEGLLAAKGYPRALAFIQPQAVTVVVDRKELTEVEALQVADLVVRATGRKLEEVFIVPRGI